MTRVALVTSAQRRGPRRARSRGYPPHPAQLALDIDVESLVQSTAQNDPSPRRSKASQRRARPGTALSQVMLDVSDFHATFGLIRQTIPNVVIPPDLAQLRVDLLREEVDELATATSEANIVGIADALADIVYVAYGSAVTYGIDLDAVLAEVHRSNMSKLDSLGRPVFRADGKVAKSTLYTPPDVRGVLHEQLALPW